MICKFCQNIEKAKIEYERSVKMDNSNLGTIVANGSFTTVCLEYDGKKLALYGEAEWETNRLPVNFCPECGKKF